MTRLAAALILLGLALLPGRALADGAPAYQARAAQLVDILAAPGGEADFFSSLFLDAVPLDRWRAIAADLRKQHGVPQTTGSIRQESTTAGQVEIRFDRATVGFTLVVAPQAPNRVIGLRIVGAKITGDSFPHILGDIATLPGRSALAIARLTPNLASPNLVTPNLGPAPHLLHSLGADMAMATGSSYKLYVLAELARAVAAGERRWSDVIALSYKSFSGRLRAAPADAPMTLHSLALAMIAESDNSAADTLLLALGREKVDAMRERTSPQDAQRALPILTTAEAFALKMPANADLRARYVAASPTDRRQLLRDHAARLTAAAVDIGAVAETPVAIDQIEWFASPNAMIALLDRLHHQGGDALPILAVNPGIAPADAARWRYCGYKGGSEPGVFAMNFLLQAQDGQWYAVSGSWNDPTARVDEPRFVALMTRALNLLAGE